MITRPLLTLIKNQKQADIICNSPDFKGVTLACEELKSFQAHKLFQEKKMNRALEVYGTGVVPISDHIRSSDTFKQIEGQRAFEYSLSDKTARNKLMKAAKRDELMKIEENSSSSNLVFSAGAWHTVVLPTLRYWNEIKDDKACNIGDYTIKIGGITGGVDANGKHVDSKVVFLADRDKVTCHLYNTTCLILVNGHGYRKLIELFLAPFFKTKLKTFQEESEGVNEMVLEKLGTKSVKRADIKYKKGSSFPCTKCEHAAKSISALNKHKRVEHTSSLTIPKTSSKSIKITKQSTGNNSMIEPMMIEDVTITDLDCDSINLEEKSLKLTCNICEFVTHNKTFMDNHVNEKHVSKTNEDREFPCMKCENVYNELDNYNIHVKTHDDRSIIVNVEKEEVEEVDDDFAQLTNFVYNSVLEHQVEEEALKYRALESTNNKCSKCDYVARNQAWLHSHEINKHVNRPQETINFDEIIELTCRLCEFDAEDEEGINNHKKYVHPSNSWFKCKLCNDTFGSKTNLEEHGYGIFNTS